VANGSLDHAYLCGNLSTLHSPLVQIDNLLVTSLALGLTGLLCMSFGSRPWMTVLLV
jgi:hypothetical protein